MAIDLLCWSCSRTFLFKTQECSTNDCFRFWCNISGDHAFDIIENKMCYRYIPPKIIRRAIGWQNGASWTQKDRDGQVSPWNHRTFCEGRIPLTFPCSTHNSNFKEPHSRQQNHSDAQKISASQAADNDPIPRSKVYPVHARYRDTWDRCSGGIESSKIRISVFGIFILLAHLYVSPSSGNDIEKTISSSRKWRGDHPTRQHTAREAECINGNRWIHIGKRYCESAYGKPQVEGWWLAHGEDVGANKDLKIELRRK